MFSHIIVGIDGERTDPEAVTMAHTLAPDAVLDLVCVFPHSARSADRDLDSWGTLLRDRALDRLRKTKGEAGVSDAQIHAIPSFNPAKALRHRASEMGADLIVLGAPSKAGLDRVVLGDVGRSTLHGAPCPVLIARGERMPSSPAVIGVAYDRSAEAVQALHTAVDLARSTGARLEIVEAMDVTPSPAVWGFTVTEYLDSLVGPEDQRMQAMAEALDVPATGAAVRGPVAEVLRELSSRVDLMICGSRSWGAPGRIAFGSTADRLIHQSRCPVLVVPRGATAGLAADAAGSELTEVGA